MFWTEGGIGYLIVGAIIAGIAGVWAYFKAGGRKRTRVELEAQKQAAVAQKQSALGELFEDAQALQNYVQQQIKNSVEPLEKKLNDVTAAQARVHTAFRTFFTQVFFWDRGGRVGALPIVPADVLEELRLEHFLGLPFEDTEPVKKEGN